MRLISSVSKRWAGEQQGPFAFGLGLRHHSTGAAHEVGHGVEMPLLDLLLFQRGFEKGGPPPEVQLHTVHIVLTEFLEDPEPIVAHGLVFVVECGPAVAQVFVVAVLVCCLSHPDSTRGAHA